MRHARTAWLEDRPDNDNDSGSHPSDSQNETVVSFAEERLALLS